MIGLKDIKPTWVDQPSEGGWWWMRWKPKYRRRWAYEVVWCGLGGQEVKTMHCGWRPIDKIHRELKHGPHFCGPLIVPPGE